MCYYLAITMNDRFIKSDFLNAIWQYIVMMRGIA